MTNTPLQDIQQFQTDAEIFDAWLHGAADTTVEFGPGDVRPTLASLISGLFYTGIVSETASYVANGTEGTIEADFSAPGTITIAPALLVDRQPMLVRKTDQTAANTVAISDGGSNPVCFEIATPANANGNGGGWCYVGCDATGTKLRCWGVN